MPSERTVRRLALLEGVRLSEADLESILAEFDEFDRALDELQAFAELAPFPFLPVQPYTQDVRHERD